MTMAVFRFAFALLLGVILGAGSVVYLIHSGAGDFMIRRTEPVQDLERRLRDVEQQRDQLGRQLDDVINRAGRMEASWGSTKRRGRTLARVFWPIPETASSPSMVLKGPCLVR